MSLTEIREGGLSDVFTALEEAFNATGTDFYVIGAMARDVWYEKGQKSSRGTKDVDFAVLVSSHEEYEAVRNYLKEKYQYEDTRENAFVMISPSGTQVDLLPFGEIAIDDSITIKGEGMTSIDIDGFNEVYQEGTEEVELSTGHKFEVATLPAIVLLKLIAFDDRPERRTKDARDIANIIEHFFDLQEYLIYNNYSDEFLNEDDPRTLEEISATVIGREIKGMLSNNKSLHERVVGILEEHIKLADESKFVRNMVAETNRDVEQCLSWLKCVLDGLSNKKN